MNSFKNFEAYSWNHIRAEYAAKIIGNSLIRYCETGDKVNIILIKLQEYTLKVTLIEAN